MTKRDATWKRELIGEALGTFVLVLFGCGSVAATVLFNAHHGLTTPSAS